MTTFKKTNEERRALMKVNSNFQTFLNMNPTRATKDAKWIIRGFISGRRKYNEDVMKQQYDIMRNVRLRKRGGRIAVYLDNDTHPFYKDCDSPYRYLCSDDEFYYRYNNGDNRDSIRRVINCRMRFNNGKIRPIQKEMTMIKLVDNELEYHKKVLPNYRLLTLNRYNRYNNYYKDLNDCLKADWCVVGGVGKYTQQDNQNYKLKRLLSYNNVRGRSKMKKKEMIKAIMEL